jgi:hypothetical protein
MVLYGSIVHTVINIVVIKPFFDWVRDYQHLNKGSTSLSQFAYAAEKV